MIRRLIAWWLSAPMDEKAAVAVIVGPWLALAALLLSLPPPRR
ncbi:hypothetical protein [Luteibacter rhizovicinus]|nr:hypothetical protein [Luteibacter rhizovicinus]